MSGRRRRPNPEVVRRHLTVVDDPRPSLAQRIAQEAAAERTCPQCGSTQFSRWLKQPCQRCGYERP